MSEEKLANLRSKKPTQNQLQERKTWLNLVQRGEAKKLEDIPRHVLECAVLCRFFKFEKRTATSLNRRVERKMIRRCKARSDTLLTTFIDRSIDRSIDLVFSPCKQASQTQVNKIALSD